MAKIHKNLPNGNVKVLTSHKIALNHKKDDNVVLNSIMDDVVVNCTILTTIGKVMAKHDCNWFPLSSVGGHVSHSVSTMVASQLMMPPPTSSQNVLPMFGATGSM